MANAPNPPWHAILVTKWAAAWTAAALAMPLAMIVAAVSGHAFRAAMPARLGTAAAPIAAEHLEPEAGAACLWAEACHQ